MADGTHNNGGGAGAARGDQGANGAPPAGAEGATEQAQPQNPNMRWYIIHSYSGFERKVKESLETRAQAFGLQTKIGRVVIPTEPVTEIRNGKKYTTERAFLPGYVLVEMDMDLSNPEGQNLWHVVKNTPRVTGFLGAGNQPTPLTEEEVHSIADRVETAKEKPKLHAKMEKNESATSAEGH